MTTDVLAPTALRDSLAVAAYDAAKHRAQTDMDTAKDLAGLTVLMEMACCDETALEVLAAAPQALREEVCGATDDPWLIAAIDLAAQEGEGK